MTEPRQILIAPAWPYANGPNHIGHVTGFGVPADVLARYHRLRGDRVLMVSGTDEHGTPIMVAADNEGRSYRETADHYSDVIRRELRDLGLTYDLFTRTTTPNHYAVTQDVFRTLYDKGYIFERSMQVAFSQSTGNTLPDRYIEGTCPHCGFEAARGDQCDNCGRQLDPIELLNPRSRIDGQPPIFRDTNHLFLDLPAFAEQLREWISAQDHWRANVKRFSLNLVDDLKPRPVTRDLDWGVPIPVPGYEENERKRIYVWFDAVIGYLSASIEWASTMRDPDAWRDWWQTSGSRHYYVIGKDNVTFHTVIWPTMLLGYGSGGRFGAGRGDLVLPWSVVSSEFLTMEGKQFSTSRNVVIYLRDVLDRYGADPLRYFLVAAGPETQDTDFTWAEFSRRNNDELVATWGNLVNRTLTSAYRTFGAVPEPGPLRPEDEALLASIPGKFNEVGAEIEAARFRAALAAAIELARDANRYLNDSAPWALIETDRERAGTILYTALRTIDSLKTLLTPFLPFSSQTLQELLGYEGWLAGPIELREVSQEGGGSHTVLTGDYDTWVGSWSPSELPPGRKLREPRPLFKKLDADKVVEEELGRLEQAADTA
jgi:methionyl-tRNA synthetase